MPKNQSTCWVVTDIDGTLMDHNYDFKPALETLNWLSAIGVPVIPCTSKTASEVRLLRKTIKLKSPFIVENGGAVYGNKGNSDEEWVLPLGKTFASLRPLLDVISKRLNYPLRALTDLSLAEVRDLTGLDESAMSLALKREWSVPFLNPSGADMSKLSKIASDLNVSIYRGNRMSHLISKETHKGQAVLALKKHLAQNDVLIIGLGDSPNDLPMLDIVDIAVVIPSGCGPNPHLKQGVAEGKYLLAPAPHAVGWGQIVKEIVSQKIKEI